MTALAKYRKKKKRKAGLGQSFPGSAPAQAPALIPQQASEQEELINPETMKTLAWVLGIASALGIGGYFGIRYLVRSSKQKATAGESLTAGSAASFASRLIMAFENDNLFSWGTDEEAIKRVFEEIPNQKVYSEVQKAYSSLMPGKQLNITLREELSSSEYNEIMQLLNSKPLQ